jgi:hypothetical protein
MKENKLNDLLYFIRSKKNIKQEKIENKKRTCENKTTFYILKQAKEIAQQWNQYVYRCPFCERYHLSKRKSQSCYEN